MSATPGDFDSVSSEARDRETAHGDALRGIRGNELESVGARTGGRGARSLGIGPVACATSYFPRRLRRTSPRTVSSIQQSAQYIG